MFIFYCSNNFYWQIALHVENEMWKKKNEVLESVTTHTLQDGVLVVLEILVSSYLAGEYFGKAEEWMETKTAQSAEPRT